MKVITFSFVNDGPPAEATVVFDCRRLRDTDTSRPAAQAILAEARQHIAPDAVVAFGCGFGQQRSVAIARRFIAEAAEQLTVEVEHRALRQRYIVEQGGA